MNNIKIKPAKLTTCKVVGMRGLRKRLRTVRVMSPVPPERDEDRVVGVCEDCGALLYDMDYDAEPEHAPAQIDEWEYFL